jgi:hypothetical protein
MDRKDEAKGNRLMVLDYVITSGKMQEGFIGDFLAFLQLFPLR